jgi:hypothetical protein
MPTAPLQILKGSGYGANCDSMIDLEHFADDAKKMLPEIGGDHAVAVTKAQLAAAVLNPKFTGDQTKALVAMYENFDVLHNLSGHEGWTDTASISAADLDKFKSVEKSRSAFQSETTELKLWAHDNLTRFSSNGGDLLTKADVERALKDPATSPHDRQMLEMASIIPGKLDPAHFVTGLTVKDFDKQYDAAWDEPEGRMVSAVYGSYYDVVNDGEKACRDLYGSSDPLKSITTNGVKQGAIGDCYFEAPLASLAKTDPALIRDSIVDNHNGTYTVTFAGAKDEPITVKAPTEAELSIYNRGGTSGEWASVMEKAYGQYRENHAWLSSRTPQESADGGAPAAPVVSLLTGKDADYLEITDLSQEEAANRLKQAFSPDSPLVVVAGTPSDLFGNWSSGPSVTADGFDKCHDYSVISFTPIGKDDGKVGLRNPHAGKDGTPDGTIEIPLAEFLRNFQDISIEK